MQPDKNQKQKRPFWHKLLWLVVPLLLLLGIALIMDWQGHKIYDQAIEEARQVDPRLTFDQLEASRKEWPDEENGALLLQPILPRMIEYKEQWRDREIPIVGVSKAVPPGHRYPAEQIAALEATFQEAHEELKIINQLNNYQGGRLELDYDDKAPLDTLMPPLAPYRNIARLKCAEILYHAQQGQTDSIVENARIVLTMADFFQDEPTLISALVRIAIQSLTYETTIEACNLTELPPDQLASLQQLIAESQDERAMYWGMLGERAMNIRMGELTLSGEYEGSDMNGLPIAIGKVPGLRSVVYKDFAFGVRYMNRLVEVSRNLPGSLPEAQSIEEDLENIPQYYIFSRILLPSLVRALTLSNRMLADGRTSYCALAAERYRIEQGQWPAALNDLVPQYLEAVPIDPFNVDEPIQYKQINDGIVIYSVGENSTDDGGQVYETDKRLRKYKAKDRGVILLNPELRGQPPVAAETQTAS